jgi:hypothetical protein
MQNGGRSRPGQYRRPHWPTFLRKAGESAGAESAMMAKALLRYNVGFLETAKRG